MSNILHVVASPRGDESFSRPVGQYMAEQMVAAHTGKASIDTLDLYAEQLPPYEAPAAGAKYSIMAGKQPEGESERAWGEIIKVINRLKSSKALIISSPMWNFSIPYKLKHFIDVITQPGLTFSFSPDTGYKGLVTDIPAVLVLARGGDFSGPPASDMDFQSSYLKHILKFIGFSDIHAITIDSTLQGGPEVAAANKAAAMKTAEKLSHILCF